MNRLTRDGSVTLVEALSTAASWLDAGLPAGAAA
jgi:hypothetical protein